MPLSRLRDISRWLSGHDTDADTPALRDAAHDADGIVAVNARCWAIDDPSHSVRSIEDHTSRRFAVVDTEGVCATSATRLARQRVEVTVESSGRRYRGLGRRLFCGTGGVTEAHVGAGSVVRAALTNALDAAVAAMTGHHRTPVVFGPSAGAGLLHELVGHALEDDNFGMRSAYIAKLREGIGIPPTMTLLDDPSLADGYGSCDLDDDGISALPTTLIANGEVVGPLTSVRSAHRSGHPLTGNGRRRDYRSVSIPRARNTVVLAGDDDPTDLLRDRLSGVLHVGCLGAGMINLATGEFSFAALNCAYITPGGDRVPVRDVSLFGDAMTVLASLEGIGSDLGGDNVTCGKQDQMVGIGIFSPSMRFWSLNWSAG